MQIFYEKSLNKNKDTKEKVVHYGGEFTSPLLTHHPITAEEVLRYAESVVGINPVSLQIQGIPPAEHNYFIQSVQKRLYFEAVLSSTGYS